MYLLRELYRSFGCLTLCRSSPCVGAAGYGYVSLWWTGGRMPLYGAFTWTCNVVMCACTSASGVEWCLHRPRSEHRVGETPWLKRRWRSTHGWDSAVQLSLHIQSDRCTHRRRLWEGARASRRQRVGWCHGGNDMDNAPWKCNGPHAMWRGTQRQARLKLTDMAEITA